MKKTDIEEFFTRLQGADSAPRTELDYINPYTLLVAVVLSAQATDVGVNKATGPLFAVVDTPEKMLALGEAGLTLRSFTAHLGARPPPEPQIEPMALPGEVLDLRA